MRLRDFYGHLLPDTPHYCLFRSSTKDHLWATSLDELVDLTDQQGDRTDIYFGTASFKEAGSRTQANVDLLKAFRLDLDAGEVKLAKHGEDKIYPTQGDAIADVVRFSKETGLVPSLIVSSGEGLHIYYVLDAPVDPMRWRAVARQFQTFGEAHGLKIDTAVTADHARVLRPVGTLHPNGKRVEVLKATGKVYTLSEFASAVGSTPAASEAAPKYDLSINDDVTVVQGPPKSIKRVIEKCAAMQYAFAHQDKTEEPYWRATIAIAKHTVEGRKAAHALSKRHPEYDPDETDQKYDRYGAGPALCSTFEQFNKAACAACPHRGKVKSPIQLGEMTVVEVEALPEEQQPPPPAPPKPTGNPWDGFIPPGYDVVNRKGVRWLVQYLDIEKENDEGDKVPIRVVVPLSTDIFWFGHWADADDTTHTAKVTLHKVEGQRVMQYIMDQSLAASRAELTKYLAGKSIHMSSDKRAAQGAEMYFKDAVRIIKDKKYRPHIKRRFGLRETLEGELICAHGRYVIAADGTIERAMLDESLAGHADYYRIPLPPNPNGIWSKEVWGSHIFPRAQRYVEFLRKYYSGGGLDKFQLSIMLTLASPLIPFTHGVVAGDSLPPNGLTVSLYSRNGGKGKTTAMRSASMAFGNPDALTQARGSAGSTELARQALLSTAGSMPTMMDEMGSNDPKKNVELIRLIANGTARIRLDRDGSIKESPPWSLICTFGTNYSQREMIAQDDGDSSAVHLRLLELDVEDMEDRFDRTTRTAFVEEFTDISTECAGALGALIHYQICRTGNRNITKLVQANVAEADRLTNSKQSGRFQYRALGAVITLHQMMTSLGLELFELDRLVSTFSKANADAQEYADENVSADNGLELLSRALFSLQPYTLVTASEVRRNGKVKDYDVVIGRIPHEVRARHVADSGMTYVSVDALRDWCRERRLRESDILGPAKQKNILRRVYASSYGTTSTTPRWGDRYNLLRGLRENTNTYVRCYLFSTRDLAEATGTNFDRLVLDAVTNTNVVQLAPTG